MILNTIKSIQKFSGTSRKYRDLEATASHCIDKLKFFIGYTQLQNEEFQDLNIEFDDKLDLKECLEGPITNEIKSIIYYVDKKKIKDLSAGEYERHIDLLYPFMLGPIFKACKQYTSPKLTIISLEGIHKLLSFESLSRTLVEEAKLYGCEDIADSQTSINGLEFVFALLFDIYDSKVDDDSIVIQIIKASIPLIAGNVECLSCQVFYSIFLTLVNIYSSTIDNGIRAAAYSILMHFVNMSFDDSLESRSEYFEKYFLLMLEVLYALSMTEGMIYIKKQETQRGRLNNIKFTAPLSLEFHSKDFVEVEDNFFKFSQIRELDPRILRIRNLSLEVVHGILVKTKLREHQNKNIKDTVQRLYRLHFLSIMKNIVLSDPQARKNAIDIWSSAIPIYDLNQTVHLHGVFISKCVRGLFESGAIEASDRTALIGSIFGALVGNIRFLTFLFAEFDLKIDHENLVLNTINFLINQVMEGGAVKSQQRSLHNEILTMITDLLANLLEELRGTPNAGLSDDSIISESILLVKKHLICEYIQDFNDGHYERSIDLLSEVGLLDKESDVSIARFLVQNSAVSRKAIGDYISLPGPRNRQVLHQYCNQFSFKGQSLDFSLYMFLSSFHLPGEAQKIDRIIEEFSLRYFLDNPEQFQNKDKIYIISFSLIMLHTDAHSREIKNYYRMSKSDFIKNHSDLVLVSPGLTDFLERFYDNITSNEWIFEASKETCKVYFPYIEYLINFIGGLDSRNASLGADCSHSSSTFQIKVASHEIIHKVANLLHHGKSPVLKSGRQDLLKFIDLAIKRKFEIVHFNGVYTEDLVYWRLIANAPIHWIIGLNECIKGRKLPVFGETQQESTYFQYDGLNFKGNSKLIHSNTIQSSNVIGTNQNLSKWMTNFRANENRSREISGVFQSSISNLIKEFIPGWRNRQLNGAASSSEKVFKVEGCHIKMLGRMICCYFTRMLSNIDFWVCFGKDTMASWIPILKYTTELGIMLGLESSFTLTLTVLSYLTNMVSLPLHFSDLFFCNSSISEEARAALNDEVGLENEKYSRVLRFPDLERNGMLGQFSELMIRSFQLGLNQVNEFESKLEGKWMDENERLTAHLQTPGVVQGSEGLLSLLLSSEAFSSNSSLNYLNIEAIKTLFEICQKFGDRLPYILWVIMVGIISQVDRYFYVKSVLKGNCTELPDHHDHSKLSISKSRAFGNDLPTFLTLSKICINTTKSHAPSGRHFTQVFNRRFIKSTRSIFNSTRSAFSHSGACNSSRENSASASRPVSPRGACPDRAMEDEDSSLCLEGESSKISLGHQSVVILGQNAQFVQVYMNLRGSILLNNLWFRDDEVIEASSAVGANDEILWVDEEKYALILSHISLINLRRIEMVNSKLITNELEFCQVLERIFTGITVDARENKRVITDLFLALVFNARNQILLSGRKSVELLLFRKIFEFLDLILDCSFEDFPQVTLWDRYFIPVFYVEVIQILDGKAYLEVLDLIKSFVSKYIRAQNDFIRSKCLDKEAENIIITSSIDLSLERRLSEGDSRFRYVPSRSLNSTQFSTFTLLKKLLDASVDHQDHNGYIATVELCLEILNNIQNLYAELKLFNLLDLYEIIEIYQSSVIGIQKCSEKLQERSTGSHCNKKKRLISLLNSSSHSSKEESQRNRDNEVLARVCLCLMGVSEIAFLIDDGVFTKLMDTLFVTLKLFAQKIEIRQTYKVLDHLLAMFYCKIRYIHTQDLEDWSSSRLAMQSQPRTSLSKMMTTHHKGQCKLLLKYLKDFSQLVTNTLVFERTHLDSFYHYLVRISKVINYWLGVCSTELILQEVPLVQSIVSDIVGLIALNGSRTMQLHGLPGATSDHDKKKGVRLLDKLACNGCDGDNQTLGRAVVKSQLDDYSDTDEYYDDYDLENDEDDEDEDNCLVNDEADLNIIRYISYNSGRSEKSTFEVTNTNSHLDNTQLTLSNQEDIKMKVNTKSNLSVLNRRIKEMNKALTIKIQDKGKLVSDEILENASYDDIRNIKSDKEDVDSRAIGIIHNVYKIIEFYIFKTSIKSYKFLFKDWLILSNQVLLSQVMNIFSKDDIRVQYRMVMVYLSFIFKHKCLFGYREWHQIFQYYSNFIIDFTKSTQIDPSKYVIEDLKNKHSIDDFGVVYGERSLAGQVDQRISKDDGAVDSHRGRQKTQLEAFFRSKIFNKKYFGLVESRKSIENDNYGPDSSRSAKFKMKGRRISLKQCLEKNWRCYSHKYIKNTGDQEMYDSYLELRKKIQELVQEDLSGRRPRNDDKKPTLGRPECIDDLYSVLLVIYKLVFDWYITDLRTSERELDMGINKMIYDSITSSLNKLYLELISGLNLLKFDIFQYNVYLILCTELDIRKELSLHFKDNLQYYKNELLSQCEDILARYIQIEKAGGGARERKEKGGHSEDHNEKKRQSSIISPNIHFNHHFNSSYDRVLKNKIDLASTYRAVLNGLLIDLNEMKESDYIMKSPRLYKILLDITLLEDQNLRVLSRDILIEFAKRREPQKPSLPISPASSSASEERILPLLDEFSS
ncbi:large Sec7 domain-containing protein [Cryptosporidium canis]|uniref:Large Sec7 domain-containing protein n=1 Tax=Cryptosporidium canis TaxID=195482 RepID=A0ABQ8PC97_9CRYT|nr:large Sec7 domain-containing protein [Cryptosporidium canis]